MVVTLTLEDRVIIRDMIRDEILASEQRIIGERIAAMRALRLRDPTSLKARKIAQRT